MTKEGFAVRLKNACACVAAAEGELTEIDSRFGDADHGLTMSKIAKAISDAVEGSEGGIRSMLDDAAMAVMSLNGGSAVPLWNTWLDGMQEAAPEGDEIDIPGLQAVFAKALEELDDISGAKVGDKTMMDALIPASQAIAAYDGQQGIRVQIRACQELWREDHRHSGRWRDVHVLFFPGSGAGLTILRRRSYEDEKVH